MSSSWKVRCYLVSMKMGNKSKRHVRKSKIVLLNNNLVKVTPYTDVQIHEL